MYIAINDRFTCTKQALCLLHWLLEFTLAVPIFSFTGPKNHLYD